MNSDRKRLLAEMATVLVLGQAFAQNPMFTSQFPIDDCHFSAFGGQPHFFLNPGHQLILKGEEDGEEKVLTITALDETKEITLRPGGKTRKILTRVVEERETVDGDLFEVSRNYYARCLETGDVYYFGEAVDFYENGIISGHGGSWEAGVSNAIPGIIMPRTFLLGSRYFQELAPGTATDQAENTAMDLTIDTPVGTFSNCVQVTEYNPLEPGSEPSIKTYAPGIGLISDDDVLKLDEFNLGKTDGVPRGCTFVPFSNNPFFPFAPGRRLVLEGEEDAEDVTLIITVLDEIREIPLLVGGEQRVIQTRVVEERESVDDELAEVSRNFFAQCLETGDVYYFGEEVDFYEDGKIVGHGGAWIAGVSNAQPGIIMPGHFAVGAQYFQEMASGVAEDFAMNSAVGVTIRTPAGKFSNCVTVTESNPLRPNEEPEEKTYAPGIGLINDADVLKLTAFTDPTSAAGSPVLSIQDAVLLTWPLTETLFRLESSSNLQNWNAVPQRPIALDGRNQTSLPRGEAQKYFRLSSP